MLDTPIALWSEALLPWVKSDCQQLLGWAASNGMKEISGRFCGCT